MHVQIKIFIAFGQRNWEKKIGIIWSLKKKNAKIIKRDLEFLNLNISDISVSIVKEVITTGFISSVSNNFSTDFLSGPYRYEMLKVVYTYVFHSALN